MRRSLLLVLVVVVAVALALWQLGLALHRASEIRRCVEHPTAENCR